MNPLPEIRNAVPLPLNRGKNMSLPLFNANKIADDRPNISQRNFNKQKVYILVFTGNIDRLEKGCAALSEQVINNVCYSLVPATYHLLRDI